MHSLIKIQLLSDAAEIETLLFTEPTYTYLLTYLLTAWSEVLLEKLTGFQLVKKFPAFYGTRRFQRIY